MIYTVEDLIGALEEWDGIPCIKTGRLFTPRS